MIVNNNWIAFSTGVFVIRKFYVQMGNTMSNNNPMKYFCSNIHFVVQIYGYSKYTTTPTRVANEIFRIRKIIIAFGANNLKIP